MQERIQSVFSETNNVLNALYLKRKRTLFFQRIMWGVTGLYFVFILGLLTIQYIPSLQPKTWSFLETFKPTPSNPYGSIYPMAGLIVLLYPTIILFTKAFQKFKIAEQKTMAKMVGMLFPKVEFTQGARAPVKEVVNSTIFPWIKQDSPIYSFGQIRSRTNQNEINIADIGIIENNVTNRFLGALMHIPVLNMFAALYQNVFKNIAMGKLADNTRFTFRGMFCWLSFKKHLNGHTVVLPKNQMVKLNRLTSFNFKEEQEIHLEDLRFTDKFVVYSTNQVEARYVLSSLLMEKVVALKEKFNRPILMSFQNKQMYLAVENENGLFSFSSRKLDKLGVVEELAHEIHTALQVSEELKLNPQV